MRVKGHLGSPEVKRSKPCKRSISRTVSQRDLIIGVWVGHIEYCRWSLSFLVEIKVHLGSPEINRSRLCTHCNLREVAAYAYTKHVDCPYYVHDLYCFVGGLGLPGVITGEKFKTL